LFSEFTRKIQQESVKNHHKICANVIYKSMSIRYYGRLLIIPRLFK